MKNYALLKLMGYTTVLTCAAPVFAEKPGGIEEILVTAQKREESIQSIPFAITAVSEEALKKNGITGIESFYLTVPSFQFTSQGRGKTPISLRGINAGPVRVDDSVRAETVGFYFNDIPISEALYTPDIDFFDMQRVEVLRGPQGTLYGSGSLSGTVKLVSNMPNLKEWETKAEATLSNTAHGDGNQAFKAAVSAPIIEDKVALRLVGYSDDQGGFVDRIGPIAKEDYNESDKVGGRAILTIKPSENLTLTPTFVYQKQDSEGTTADDVLSPTYPALGGQPSLDGEYEILTLAPDFFEDELSIYNLTAEYDLPWASVVSSTSYTDRDILFQQDFTWFLQSIFTTFPLPPTWILDNKNIETFTQEIRLVSTGDGPLKWIGGIYYSDSDQDFGELVLMPGATDIGFDTSLFGGEGDILIETDYTTGVRQVALFGEVSYQLRDNLTATLGLRWFDLEQDFRLQARGILNGEITDREADTSDDGINPRFILSYEPSDRILLSAQASKGFRLGGPNDIIPVAGPASCQGDLDQLGLTTPPVAFDPETLWNYELAAKTLWADGRLLVNASAFYLDYQDIQIDDRLSCGRRLVFNSGKARSVGAELEIVARLMEGMELSIGSSVIDSELREDLPTGEAQKGDSLLFSPEFMFSASLYYTRPLSENMDGFFNIGYRHRSDAESFYNNPVDPTDPVDPMGNKIDSQDLVNFRIGVLYNNWEVSAFVDNMFDERNVTAIEASRKSVSNPSGARRLDLLNRPRTFGLNVKVDF